MAIVGRAVFEPGGRALLVGEPGVGRSTVLAWVEHLAEESGSRVLRVRPGRSATGAPFTGLADLLSGVVDEELAGLAVAERRALDTVRAQGSGLVSLPSPAVLRLAISHAMRALRASGPVVVSVDDWTQLDTESADVLAHVVTRLGGPSLLATQVADGVLTGHHRSIDRELFRPGTVHLVPSLSARGMAEVLAGWRGRTTPPDVLLDVHRAVGGNPTWATELLDDPAWSSASSRHLAPRLPDSMAETVVARVRSLPPEVQRVLAVCAALGGAPAQAVVTVSGTDPLVAATAMEQGVVVERDEQLVAAHPLLGAAAQRLVGLPARLEIHARAATVATDAVERARHLDRARLPGPDDVVATALAAAADQTWAQGRPDQAMTFAARALARSARGSAGHEERAVGLAEMAAASAAPTRALAVLASLDLKSLTPQLLDRALPVLVTAVTADRGAAAAQRVLAELAADTPTGSVRGAMIDVRRSSDTESVPHRVERVRRALDLMAGGPHLPAAQHRGLALALLAHVDAGHGLDPVVLDRMRALEAELPMLPLLDTADAAVGCHGYQVGDLSASRLQLEELTARAERTGDITAAGVFRVHLAVVEVLGGRHAHAAGLLERFASTGPVTPGVLPVLVRARASLALLRDDQAALETALATPAGGETLFPGRITRLALRGAWAAVHERWAEAVPALSEAVDLTAARGCEEPGRRLWADTMLGPGLVALGRVEEADRIATRLEEAARSCGSALTRGHALRLRGLLSAATGRLDLAHVQLLEAADVLAERRLPGDHARCLLDVGRVLRRRRDHEGCRRVLHEVLAIARQTGDRPLLALVEHELSSPERNGAPDVLTSAEERVAAAAAAGLRNREIAAACFVSVRTVETQLSTVYRKLGVRSRVELAARLRGEVPDSPALDGGSAPSRS